MYVELKPLQLEDADILYDFFSKITKIRKW